MELKARTLITEHTEESSGWAGVKGVRVIFRVVKEVNYRSLDYIQVFK